MTIYLDHFGLKEAPFKITPHTEFFFTGANRGETLEALLYAITSGEGMVKVTGEVGSGKTMLCRVLMERLPSNVETVYLAVPSISRDEILSTIASDIGVKANGGKTTQLIRALQERLIAVHAEGRQVVALIDEAHAMPLETLEEIRLLSNLETSHNKLMQIVLFGQPELDEILLLPNMRQLRERITHSFNLLPWPVNDIGDYVNFRLHAAGYRGPPLFDSKSLKLIGEASEGLTRRINIFADKTLLAAFAAGTHKVTIEHVRAAISDSQVVPFHTQNKKLLATVACAALIGGLAIGFLLGRLTAAPAEQVHVNSNVPQTKAMAATTATASLSNGNGETPPGSAIQTAVVATVDRSPDQVVKPESAAIQKSSEKITSGASEVLPKPTATKAPLPAAQKAIPVTNAAELSKATDATSPTKSAAPEWLQARLASDRTRIAAIGESSWVVHLILADQTRPEPIAAFLRSADGAFGAERTYVYPAGTPESPKIGVFLGSFADRDESTTAIAELPKPLVQSKPYARSIAAVRANIRSD